MGVANSGSVGKGKPLCKKVVLTPQEAVALINSVGPSLGCGDHTYDPVFPDGRKDVCAVRRMAENGNDYGFDTIYVVWKKKDGTINFEKLTDSRWTKDYINIEGVLTDGDTVVVQCFSGGSFSGKSWKSELRAQLT